MEFSHIESLVHQQGLRMTDTEIEEVFCRLALTIGRTFLHPQTGTLTCDTQQLSDYIRESIELKNWDVEIISYTRNVIESRSSL